MSLKALLEDAKFDVANLLATRKTVLIVGAFSPTIAAEESAIHEFKITSDVQRDDLYDEFVSVIQPRLEEQSIKEGSDIKTLVVPSGDSTGSTFIIDRSNYFFRRGAASSNHPFHKAFKDGSADDETSNWLKADPDRGQQFILEVRRKLRDFCLFQHRNREVLIAFMEVLHLLKGQGGLLAGITQDETFPPGMVEQLVDFFYHAPENCSSKQLASLLPFENLDGLVDTDVDAVRATLRTTANCFRAALMARSAPAACRVGDMSALETSRDVLRDQGDLATEFARAKKAISSIQEVLPCHVLPQDSIRWMIEELFQLVTNRREPLKGDYNQIAEVLQKGIEKEVNGKRRSVTAPPNEVLSKNEREKTRDNVLNNIDILIEYLFAPEKGVAAKDESLKELIDQLRQNDECKQLKDSFIPPGETMPASVKQSMQEGAKKFFRILFLSKVAPKMFSLPYFEMSDLENEILAKELAAILASLALNAGSGDLDLSQMSDELAGKISESLRAKTFDTNGLAISAEAAFKSIIEVAKQIGPKIQDRLELWRVASDLKKGVTTSEASFTSSLGHIRRTPVPGKVSQCVDAAEVVFPKSMVREMAERRLRREQDKAEFVKKTKSIKEEADKVQERLKVLEAEISEVGEKLEKAEGDSVAPLVEEKDSKLKEETNLKSAADANEKRIKENKEKFASLLKDEADEDKTERGNKLKEIFAAENLVQAGDDPAEAGVNARLLEGDLNERVQKVVERYMADTADIQSSLAALGTAENVNHQVFETYAKNKDAKSAISFRRTVEAMVLAKALCAGNTRVGIGGDSSGLLKAIIHLVELTGKDSDEIVDAFELLKQKSLQEYIDGGLLKEGKTLANLRGELKDAAKRSFDNISELVSELHGVYYLLSTAPDGTTVKVFNGSASQFRERFLNAQLNIGGGPFGSANDRPGIVYLSNLAFGKDEPKAAELGVWNDFTLADSGQQFIVPPVLLSSDVVGEKDKRATDWKVDGKTLQALLKNVPFPFVIAGPDHFLNAREDRDFRTSLPAAYSILQGFLQSNPKDDNSQLAINQAVANDNSSGRLRSVAGGSGIQVGGAVASALLSTNDGHSFAADYLLYVALIIRMNTSGQDGDGARLFSSLRNHNTGGVSSLKDIKGFTECLLAAYDEFYFGDGPAGGREDTLKSKSDPDQKITDIQWFSTALKSLGLQ